VIAQRANEIIRYTREGMQEEIFVAFKIFIFVIGYKKLHKNKSDSRKNLKPLVV
jgi:hypothetical protein